MHVVGLALIWVINLYLLLLTVRMILSWVTLFSGSWQPRGFLLVLLEGIYSITDPPIKAVNKYVPPLRLGGIALDLGFMLLFLVLMILRQLVAIFLL